MRTIDREPALSRRARGQAIEYRAFAGALFLDRSSGAPALDRARRIEAVRATELRQGAIGNCAFLSAVGAVARLAPERLVDLLSHEDELGCTVRLHRHVARTRVPLLRELPMGGGAEFETRVTFRFPVFRSTGRPCFAEPFRAHRRFELWLLTLEKAYAQLHGAYWLTQVGLGAHALATLTGLRPTLREPRLFGLARLSRALADGCAVTATTLPNPLLNRPFGSGLFPTHVYQVERVDDAGRIELVNPHGPERGLSITFAELCRYFLSLAVLPL